MNTTQIEYFLTLCKYKNYSETARRLFVSQPTVSKQIAALEQELGLSLFERSTNSLHLTMQGAIMKQAFTEALELVSEAQEKALNQQAQIADTVNIGILESADIGPLLINPLTEIINYFEKSVKVQIAFFSHKELNEQLDNDTIDIGITLNKEVANHTSLSYSKLRTLPLGIIAHKDLQLTRNGVLDLDLLHQLPFYFSTHGSLGVKEFLKEEKEVLGIPESCLCNTPNIETMLVNVEHKMGTALVLYTPRIQSNDDLIFYPLEEMPLTIVAAWNKNNQNVSRGKIIKRMRRIIIENGTF